MNLDAFIALIDRFQDAASAGDAAAFAACFTPDAVYHDYVYGPFAGRAAIAHMLTDHFHAQCTDYDWRFFDHAVSGATGYAHSLSRFISTVPEFAGKEVVIDGISRFRLADGLIAEYWESVNAGVAHVQLGVALERSAKVFARWARELRALPDTLTYVGEARTRSTR
jgi:ketosteroid isomerase-like protein